MLQTLARNWWAVVLRGVFAVLFGLGTFLWPGLNLAVLVLMYGGYLFIDGILAVVSAFARRREGAFPWGVFLAGLVSLVAGLFTLFWPGVTALALLYLDPNAAPAGAVTLLVSGVLLIAVLEAPGSRSWTLSARARVSQPEESTVTRSATQDESPA